ncbi:response regulator transcription factor [Pedobacter antarcticus]|uniref:response regulator transcription factor n=1 Tax=Pedobacter antarcticus TaxID=34086 RepID=UPI001C585268|nr:response regulator transcription factor [Pedobacter antarcticus]
MYKIGIAEDDTKIASLIKSGLEEHEYQVETFPDGITALHAFLEEEFDLIILDVMMPGMNGMEICRRLRKVNTDIPVMLLTALGTVDDKVAGLETGADDYLAKPFHFRELLARISALLRRKKSAEPKKPHKLNFEDIELDLDSKTVQRSGTDIRLTAKEFILLELFLRNTNKLLSRQYIAENAWDINFDTGTNVIDVYVNFLRNKIDKGFERKLIHTKIGMGYIMK